MYEILKELHVLEVYLVAKDVGSKYTDVPVENLSTNLAKYWKDLVKMGDVY